MNVEGFYDVKPIIRKITFLHKGKFDLHLEDERIISVPFQMFPDIQNLSAGQRKKWYILDDCAFSFDDCDEVYHIEQILGKYEDYKYSFLPAGKAMVNEPNLKYKHKTSRK